MSMLVPPLFVYGTLRDGEVFRLITGLDSREVGAVPARAPGHVAMKVAGASYPVLVAAAGEVAEGLVLTRLPAATLSPLDRYEGPGYRRAPLTVETAGGPVAAQVYVATAPPATDGRWSIETWTARSKARFLAAISGTRIAAGGE